jgi:hypothetical protein
LWWLNRFPKVSEIEPYYNKKTGEICQPENELEPCGGRYLTIQLNDYGSRTNAERPYSDGFDGPPVPDLHD